MSTALTKGTEEPLKQDTSDQTKTQSLPENEKNFSDLEALDRKDVAKIGGLAAVISSLCCLTPVVIVLILGSASIGTAATLGDDLYYGPARWALYGLSMLFMAAAVGYFYYKRGVCTLDAAKRHRNQMLNTFGMVLLVGLVGYLIFTYVILEIAGIALGLPWEAWW